MADKTDAQVVIGGRTYTLSGYESEEYLLRIADYLNGKIDELAGDAEYARLTTDMRQLLLNLNIFSALLTKKRMTSMISNTNSSPRR